MVNGELIYGKGDGNLYERTFNGTTLGSEVLIDPYDDPYWENVDTGSGQTFKGQRSDLAAELSVGDLDVLHQRPAVLHADRRCGDALALVRAGVRHRRLRRVHRHRRRRLVGHRWRICRRPVAATRSTTPTRQRGALSSIGWNGTQATGSPTVVDTTQNWASRGMFMLADADEPEPAAGGRLHRDLLGDATSLHASTRRRLERPGRFDLDYAWNYGDGPAEHHAAQQRCSPTTSAQPGNYTVTLTVTDNDGATDTKTMQVIGRPDHHRCRRSAGRAVLVHDRVRRPAARARRPRSRCRPAPRPATRC